MILSLGAMLINAAGMILASGRLAVRSILRCLMCPVLLAGVAAQMLMTAFMTEFVMILEPRLMRLMAESVLRATMDIGMIAIIALTCALIAA